MELQEMNDLEAGVVVGAVAAAVFVAAGVAVATGEAAAGKVIYPIELKDTIFNLSSREILFVVCIYRENKDSTNIHKIVYKKR